MMFQVVFPLLSQHSPLPWSSFDEQDFLVPETLQANVKLSTARPLCLSPHTRNSVRLCLDPKIGCQNFCSICVKFVLKSIHVSGLMMDGSWVCKWLLGPKEIIYSTHNCYKNYKTVTNITKMFQTLTKTDWKKTSPHKITTSNT